MLPRVLSWFLVWCCAVGLALAEPQPANPTAGTGFGPVPVISGPAGQTVVPGPKTPEVALVGVAREPWPVLFATLLLHVLATVFGLRAGMKLFYENAVLAGFVAVVAIDVLVVLAMELAGPFTEGASATLGPQAVVSAIVMVPTLYRFGFTKDHVTVLLAVAVGKTLGTLAEVALRFLFLDAMLRHLAGLGW